MAFFGKNKKQDKDVRVYEQWQMDEIVKCSIDPVYFITTYCKIIHKDKGLIPFELYDYQIDYINMVHNNRFSVVMFPRQTGKTTTMCGYIAWYTIFQQDKTVCIMANKEETAKEVLSRLKDIITNLPAWLKPWIDNWAATKITFKNGNVIKISSSSESAVRGISGNLVYLDEFAHLSGGGHLQELFYTSVYPTIISGQTTKLIITSTPNGIDLFHKIYTKAIKKENQFKSMTISWDACPGRDENFKKMTIADIGQLKWDQEFECKFIGSQATLIDPELLASIDIADPVKVDWDGMLKIYEYPMEVDDMESKGWFYLISVDPCMGTRKDYGVSQVLLVKSNMDIEQVAVMSSNNKNPADYSNYVARLGKIYNYAKVIVETNGEAGGTVNNTLRRVIQYQEMLKLDQSGGFNSNSKTRREAYTSLKIYIENNLIKVRDRDTINELYSFVKIGNTYKADGTNHDDHVTSFFPGISYIRSNKFFGNIEDRSLFIKDMTNMDADSENIQGTVDINSAYDVSALDSLPDGKEKNILTRMAERLLGSKIKPIQKEDRGPAIPIINNPYTPMPQIYNEEIANRTFAPGYENYIDLDDMDPDNDPNIKILI